MGRSNLKLHFALPPADSPPPSMQYGEEHSLLYASATLMIYLPKHTGPRKHGGSSLKSGVKMSLNSCKFFLSGILL